MGVRAHLIIVNDTKLSGTVYVLGARDVIQRELYRFEEWVHVNFIKFNEAKR